MKYHKYKIQTVVIVLLSLLFSSSIINAAETQRDDILGVWGITENSEIVEKIEIYKCDEFYCGKIVWIKQTDSTGKLPLDEKNKKKALRTRQLFGLEIMKNFKFDGKNSWKDGKLYAYRKGRIVSPKLTLIDDQHLKIQVKILFIKKSFVWKRVLPNKESGSIEQKNHLK